MEGLRLAARSRRSRCSNRRSRSFSLVSSHMIPPAPLGVGMERGRARNALPAGKGLCSAMSGSRCRGVCWGRGPSRPQKPNLLLQLASLLPRRPRMARDLLHVNDSPQIGKDQRLRVVQLDGCIQSLRNFCHCILIWWCAAKEWLRPVAQRQTAQRVHPGAQRGQLQHREQHGHYFHIWRCDGFIQMVICIQRAYSRSLL